MKERIVTVALIIVAFVAGYALRGGDPNAKPAYDATGLPANCRAIVQAGINRWRMHVRQADDAQMQFALASDAMDVIERNCGVSGYSWGRWSP